MVDYTTLWSGDSIGVSITLSESPLNYKYLIFKFRSAANSDAYGTCKIPTESARFTVSTPFMFQDGGIGIDCIQYIRSGNTLNVRYQGYVTFPVGGSVSTNTSTQIHVLEIIGTDIDV